MPDREPMGASGEVELCGVLNMLINAVESENFSRTGHRDMSTNLRAALRRAREVLAAYAGSEETHV